MKNNLRVDWRLMLPPERPDRSSEKTLTTRQTRLFMEPLGDRSGYGFGLQVMQSGDWRTLSVGGNPLVRGASFDLFPETVEALPEGGLHVTGRRRAVDCSGDTLEYAWNGRLVPEGDSGWVRVTVSVNLPRDLRLCMDGGFEPEITLDMGLLPPYDRGNHVWFKTTVQNPTKWNDEAPGNDFPALYYYDMYTKSAVMMFFNMTAMDWMSRRNIARFLNYKCGFRRRYKPEAAFDLGMYADGFSGREFPQGEQRFEYWIRAEDKPEPPTEQSAVVELVRACLELVPRDTDWPEGATDCTDFATKCATDLMDDEGCWRKDAGGNEYLLPYVNGSSPAWDEVQIAQTGVAKGHDMPSYDSVVDILSSLPGFRAVRPDRDLEPLESRLVAFLDRIQSRRAEFHRTARVQHSWQFVYYLEKLWRAGVALDRKDYCDWVLEEVENYLIPFARRVQYLFPLVMDRQKMCKRENGENYSVSGMYAALLCAIHRVTGDEALLDEADRALRTLYGLPINHVLQEVMLAASGAQAAAFLHDKRNQPLHLEIAEYLRSQVLRAMYWFDDRTQPEYRHYRTFGMFNACTPIIYPAYFENIEAWARLAATFPLRTPDVGLLRAMNIARKNNFYLFPACLPDSFHMSHLDYIPFENLGILENDKTGWLGQEIYGAGQAFTAALLWDAQMRCEDRDVMVVATGAMGWSGQPGNPVTEGCFICFNPAHEERDVRLQGGAGMSAVEVVRADGALESLLMNAQGRSVELLRMGPQEIVTLHSCPEGSAL